MNLEAALGGGEFPQAEFISAEDFSVKGVPTRRKPGGGMKEASRRLEFEYAAVLRDRIIELRGKK